MSLFATLSPRELASQLRDPIGPTGLAVADALVAINHDGNTIVVCSLAICPGDQVLEVGCGLATMAEAIVNVADDVRYTGLDQSGTMIKGACARNARLMQSGKVRFQLGHVEQMPFEVGCFTKVFSVGVAHFWANPIPCLVELRRVTQPGGLIAMGALGPDRAPVFAVRENGFYLYDLDEWTSFCAAARLTVVDVQCTESEQGPQGIHLTARA